MLSLYTLLQSLVVGTVSSVVDPRIVTAAAMHTLSAFSAITLYSFQPNAKYDLSFIGNVLLAASVSLMLGPFIGSMLGIPISTNIMSGLLAMLFAGYIYYDTRKIVDGTHKHKYGQKEYILAALNLYQDIVSFFMQILRLLVEFDQSSKSSTNRRQNNRNGGSLSF